MIVIPTPPPDSRLPITAGCGGPRRCAAVSECGGDIVTVSALIRSTEGERRRQIGNVVGYQRRRNGRVAEDLTSLQKVAQGPLIVFAGLMEVVNTHSLRQVGRTLHHVGGVYRRNV